MEFKSKILSELDVLRKQIFNLLREFEYQQLKTTLAIYNQTIRQVFNNLATDNLSDREVSMLKQVLVSHQQMLRDIEIQKKAIHQELKQLRQGRAMQQTYPQQ